MVVSVSIRFGPLGLGVARTRTIVGQRRMKKGFSNAMFGRFHRQLLDLKCPT